MSEPEVSVILPVFNRAAAVGAALASALAQEGPRLEVVLVDDGSSDALEAAVEPFRGDSRLRVVRHSERRGAAAARNTGIGAARGAWMAFLDSDDEWRPGKLATQLAALRAGEPKLRMAVTAALLDRGPAGMEMRTPRTHPSCRDVVLSGCTESPGTTAIIARAAFERYGLFDERLERLEDWEWLLRFTEGENYLVVPEPLAIVRVRDFDGIAEIDKAASIVWWQHAAKVRREGLSRWRAFASAVLVERGFARLLAKRYIGAFALLTVGLVLCVHCQDRAARAWRRFGAFLRL